MMESKTFFQILPNSIYIAQMTIIILRQKKKHEILVMTKNKCWLEEYQKMAGLATLPVPLNMFYRIPTLRVIFDKM